MGSTGPIMVHVCSGHRRWASLDDRHEPSEFELLPCWRDRSYAAFALEVRPRGGPGKAQGASTSASVNDQESPLGPSHHGRQAPDRYACFKTPLLTLGLA